MKEYKGCFSHFKLLLVLMVLVIAGPFALPARAVTAPDSFREKVVDATLVCYGVFGALAEKDWPDRDQAEVYDLRRDAREKRDYSMDMLKRYSAAFSDFNINEKLGKAEAETGTRSMDKYRLLDLAAYCEKELFKLIDMEAENGYTP